MNTNNASAQGLTISDLAGRTGVAPATLRAWEARHGFPVPYRRASGHRRYDEHDVALIREVLRRREAGVRLESAIADAAASSAVLATPTTSVFAELRRAHPHLPPQRLRKATLLALSWAMEDECCARAQTPRLFAAFQEARHFGGAELRWAELARTSRSAVVFADFGADGRTTRSGVRLVHLPAEAPMRREWSLVCDAPDHVAALAAWELPGQQEVADRERLFEAVWTLEPQAVRDAARVCARLSDVLDPAHRDWSDLEEVVPQPSADLRAAVSMFQRLVSYLDSGHR